VPKALSARLAASLRVVAATMSLAACGWALTASGASAQAATTSTTVHASFLPDRLGASTALTLAMRFAASPGETPPPLRLIALHLPAGLGIELRGSSSCPLARLSQRGGSGCPQASLVGRGHAQLEVHAGSQTIPEQAVLSVFRGPSRGGAPTLEILGVGSTPLNERTISTAILRGDHAPYGTELTISIPAIPTLVYEPNASFDSLTVTLGGIAGDPRAHTAGARILVPRRCRAGGFPFAADVSFADRSTTHAATAVPCP
jgi:hypothetical protein